MNNSIPRAMQGPRLSPGAVLTVPPADILCLVCRRPWIDHAAGCKYEGVELIPSIPTPITSAVQTMHGFAVSAAELLGEIQRTAVDDLPIEDRARVLPAITAAVDAAASLRDRLSRRLGALIHNPPEVLK